MGSLDPGLERDLVDAKSAIARHGVVIIRAIETELAPALMSAAKRSLASAPSRLERMDEDELDDSAEKLRKISLRTADELKEMYVRLLAKLGTEDYAELARDLEGIGQLFTWDRISKSAEPVNAELVKLGFGPIELEGADDLSEGFELELGQRWPPAFERFRSLVTEAATHIAEPPPKQAPVSNEKAKSKKKKR